MTDFFDDRQVGLAKPFNLSPRRARVQEYVYDFVLNFRRFVTAPFARAAPQRKVLIVGVEVPGREGDMKAVVSELVKSNHNITTSIVTMGNKGKFANIEAALAAAPEPLESYDWLIITDDDIKFRPGFMDDLINYSERAGLTLSQPAHRFNSYASFAVTHRHLNSFVRGSRFVEIGPLTAIHKRAFSKLIPFPASRWCWGIDVYWSKIASDNGWLMGIIDATPVQHTRPVANSYDPKDAISEARGLLAEHGVTLNRRDVLSYNKRIL